MLSVQCHNEIKALYNTAMLDSQYNGTLFQHALTCFSQGKSEASIYALQCLDKLQPNIAEVYYTLGIFYSTLKQFSASEKAFEKAISIRGHYVDALKNLGMVQMQLNKLTEAVVSFEKVVGLDPTCLDAFRFLGDVHRKLGAYDKALAAYRSELTLAPERIDCRLDIGLTYLRQGAFENAARIFMEIIQLDPKISEVHYNLGLTYQKQQKFDLAVSAYRNALEMNPKNVGAHNNLGMVLDLLGRSTEAIDHYHEILALEPDNQGIKHILAALTGEQLKTAAPEYVVSLFDQYSDGFDVELVDHLKYTIPVKLKEAVSQYLEGQTHFTNGIDLGCGTGMCGQEFWAMTTKMTGVDLSPKMLNQASRKGVYHSLFQQDVVDFLNGSSEFFDLFVAADVFIYVGELEKLFKAVHNNSTPGAIFTFSVERFGGDSFWLCSSGRYAHSQNYIYSLAEKHFFTVEKCIPTGIRLENDKWIEGDIYILKSCIFLPEHLFVRDEVFLPRSSRNIVEPLAH